MNAKSSVLYPAVIFASVLGLVGVLVLFGLQFNVTIEQDTALIPEKSESGQSLSDAPTDESSSAVSNSQASPLQPVKQETPLETKPQLSQQTVTVPGTLRVSNQTPQPLRVALLAKDNSSASSKYGEPIHWDFAPGEGSSQGLIVSLPQGDLKLKKGDIVVAFAQDGSRRYWGPYVVGETAVPIWNQKTSEWQLILRD